MFLRKIFKRTCKYLLAVFFLLILIVLVDIRAYNRYKTNIIQQEQKQLLLMAETVGQSLENYINAEIDKIDNCFSFLAFTKSNVNDLTKLLDLFLTKNNDVFIGAIITDLNNRKIYSNLKDIKPPEILNTSKNFDEAKIISKNLSDTGYYEMLVLKRISLGENEYLNIFFYMDLQEIYLKIVAPIRIGNGGYSVVKDKDLAIIMHHAKNQIGMDAIYDRSVRYPNLDLRSLRAWLKLQTEKNSGYGILDTYIWDDPKLTPIQRLVAYTTVNIRDEQWIVNSTLPIQEISNPLMQMIMIILIVSSICFGVIIMIAVVLTRVIAREEAQKREINYLREINRGMELTAKQSEEIRHYQRVQSLGIMSSHIAHEFNNYLTPIAVYAELIVDDNEISEENRLMLREMLKSIDTAKNLSRSLLDYARQDTGAILKPLNLTEDIIEAFSVVKQLTPRAVKIFNKFTDRVVFIMGRQGMMQSILMNLSKNAFHAMENSKEKELHITFEQDEKNHEAILRVRDTGCGVSNEAKQRIFEPFYTTKGSRQGTGLGLSVVQNVVNSSGGRIDINNRLSIGTEFIIHFPMIDENTLNNNKYPIQKIIYVGKNSVKIDSILEKNSKYEISIYQHPSSVISQIEKNPYSCQLLIAEYVLPMIDGLELLEIVRRSNPKIYLILAVEEKQTKGPDLDWYVNNRIIDKIIENKFIYDELKILLQNTELKS